MCIRTFQKKQVKKSAEKKTIEDKQIVLFKGTQRLVPALQDKGEVKNHNKSAK